MGEVLVEAVNVERAKFGAVDAVKVWVVKVGDDALVVTAAVEDAVPRDDQGIVKRLQDSRYRIQELLQNHEIFL